MPKFSHKSAIKLMHCDKQLIDLFNEVIKHYDCIILCGHRNKEDQDEAYFKGHSQLKFPESKHNKTPSRAVDVAPYFAKKPHIRWEDKAKFYHFIGYVQAVADQMGIRIRSGSNWDMDEELHDQSFLDLPHFELLD